MSDADSPIFIVGASRSGTTLISACLRKHPRIHIANETHYFDDLRPKLLKKLRERPGYDFSNDATRYFQRLDAGLYALESAARPVTMSALELANEAAECGDDLDAYFEAFCRMQARRFGKQRWGEKTPRHVYQLDAILTRFPQAKVLFMVRDPRAVAASYRHWKYEGPRRLDDPAALATERDRAKDSYHPLIMAWMWRSGVRTALAAERAYGPNHVAILRYEDLVRHSEDTLKNLCAFLGEAYAPTMLEVGAINSSFRTSKKSAGISPDSVDQWQSTLSGADIAAIQFVCRAEMRCFNYPPRPVRLANLGAATTWLSLPWCAVRAACVNRSRIGDLPAYVWRRIRGVPLSGRVGHA